MTQLNALRIPRLTVRRLMVIVALSAVSFSMVHVRSLRPGLYLTAGGWSCGACVNHSERPWVSDLGKPGSYPVQFGVWPVAWEGRLAIGLEWQRGRAVLRNGSDYAVIW